MPDGAARSIGAVVMLHGMRHAGSGGAARARTGTCSFGAGGMSAGPRIVAVRQNVLKRNDELARELRRRFRDADVFVVSLVSSPGSCKTMLLEKTLAMLRQRGSRPAALVGDLATENDAARLARSEAPVKQIT